MELANNKFTLLNDTGRYNMLAVEEEIILSLQAELKRFSNKYKQGMNNKGGGVWNNYNHQEYGGLEREVSQEKGQKS